MSIGICSKHTYKLFLKVLNQELLVGIFHFWNTQNYVLDFILSEKLFMHKGKCVCLLLSLSAHYLSSSSLPAYQSIFRLAHPQILLKSQNTGHRKARSRFMICVSDMRIIWNLFLNTSRLTSNLGRRYGIHNHLSCYMHTILIGPHSIITFKHNHWVFHTK